LVFPSALLELKPKWGLLLIFTNGKNQAVLKVCFTLFYLFISRFITLGSNQNENPRDHFDMENLNNLFDQHGKKFTN